MSTAAAVASVVFGGALYSRCIVRVHWCCAQGQIVLEAVSRGSGLDSRAESILGNVRRRGSLAVTCPTLPWKRTVPVNATPCACFLLFQQDIVKLAALIDAEPSGGLQKANIEHQWSVHPPP
jgi:hypothetical protein